IKPSPTPPPIFDPRFALKNFIAGGILGKKNAAPTPPRHFDIAAWACADLAQPAFDMNLFSGAIHPAIVEDVPPQRVANVLLPPSAVIAVVPPAQVFRQECDVLAASRDEHLLAGAVQQRKTRQTLRIRFGVRLPGGSVIRNRHFDIAERPCVRERRGPADQLRLIDKGVETNVRRLNPDLQRTPLPVVARRLNRFDIDYDVA